MITQEKPKLQVSATQFQASAECGAGLINPSRSITLDDEIYLRDYALAAAVISWDKCTYGLPEQLTAADITNIALAGDTVWYQIQLHRAIPINIETFHAHRLQIQQHSSESAPTVQTQPQQAQPNSKATKQAQQPVGWEQRFHWLSVAFGRVSSRGVRKRAGARKTRCS